MQPLWQSNRTGQTLSHIDTMSTQLLRNTAPRCSSAAPLSLLRSTSHLSQPRLISASLRPASSQYSTLQRPSASVLHSRIHPPTSCRTTTTTKRHYLSSASSLLSADSAVDKIQGQKYLTGHLVLEDGTQLRGYSFGDWKSAAGEVVFNTGMVGYAESLTDPSYRGQILVCTYPMIGNYGIPSDERDEWGFLKHFESERIHARGLVVSDYCHDYSHWAANRSLQQWLKEQQIPALFGVDTRALTKRIRDKTKDIRDSSSLLGKIVADTDIEYWDPNACNLVADVSITGAKTYNPNGKLKLMLLDVGCKNSIIRRLLQRDASVTVVPWDYDIVSAMPKYDGLLISNGPGDPSTPQIVLHHLKQLMASAKPKPIYGICLGHQLMATAAGATTYKMRYGHRGHNQPCIDMTDQRCYITSQNHGYAVDAQSFGAHNAEWEPYFINANDQTSEGIRHKTKPFFSTQFHPEGAGGPEDTGFLFDRFLSVVAEHKAKGYASYTPLVARDREVVTPGTSGAKAVSDSDDKPLSIGASLARGQPIEITQVADDAIHHTHTPAIAHATPLPAIKSTKPAATGDAALENTASTAVASTASAQVPIKKVLVLGSGGLQIGQAGEFDYSGSQAIKALKEANISSVLINPNIATVQTAKGLADRVYFAPVTPEFVEQLIVKERPQGIFLQFGGQTALNCGIELDRRGVLAKYGVRVLGTSVPTIIATEDRDIFKQKLAEINEPTARSVAATSTEEALAAANAIGYPVIARAAFSLGGLGSGFAHNDDEMRTLCGKAFSCSSQVLIERSMKGWKEVEYEVVRDQYDNCVTVCNMENFDPLGIHTGDSIVVAPSQTLSDYEYHMLRKAAIRIVRHLGIVGECNVQYALHAESLQYCVIEVNPRLSRSSALASKATGYPLAFVAAKLSLGASLTEIKNSITQCTSACFEPSLDYCVVKIPRWDMTKFAHANRNLGSGMKSVGEVMGIGRNFEEAFQKAVRMVYGSSDSTVGFDTNNRTAVTSLADKELEYELSHPTDMRLFQLAHAFRRGYTVDQLHALTHIDKWFLHKLRRMHETTQAFETGNFTSATQIPIDLLAFAKRLGHSDEQIARACNAPRLAAAEAAAASAASKQSSVKKLAASGQAPVVNVAPGSAASKLAHLPLITMHDVRRARQSHGIVPVTKQIDTLAAEYPAQTNYLYSTYNGTQHDIAYDAHGVLVLGGGCYCIGNSVEFDYTAVSTIRALRHTLGKSVCMINYNPETVSTDYDESDRLYFEELTLERVLDIVEQEGPEGVIVAVGGQIPNNLVMKLHAAGVPILGTRPDDIDRAEDRSKFSRVMDEIQVGQPEWAALTSSAAAHEFADRVQYPVLVRPSYVLSGAAMKVVRDRHTLDAMLSNAKEVSSEYPVVISKFIQGAKECDFDGVAQHGELLVHAISEHVEQAGVHSGDATLVLPAQDLTKQQYALVLDAAKKVAQALHIHGPMNAQFIVQGDDVKIIECNVRASRSFPFVSKVLDVDFIKLATQVMLGGTSASVSSASGPAVRHIVNPPFVLDNEEVAVDLARLNFVAVKCPQFSFARLGGADPVTGVEMASTGEVACYGATREEAFLKALMASNVKLPGKRVLLMLGDDGSKAAFAPSLRLLNEMGYELYALPGSASYLTQLGLPHTEVSLTKQSSSVTQQQTDSSNAAVVDVFELLSRKGLDYVFSFPSQTTVVTHQNTPSHSAADTPKHSHDTKHPLSVLSPLAAERDALYKIRRAAVDFSFPICNNVQVAELLVRSLATVKKLTLQGSDEFTHSIKP